MKWPITFRRNHPGGEGLRSDIDPSILGSTPPNPTRLLLASCRVRASVQFQYLCRCMQEGDEERNSTNLRAVPCPCQRPGVRGGNVNGAIDCSWAEMWTNGTCVVTPRHGMFRSYSRQRRSSAGVCLSLGSISLL
jgi:hypothetical protein